MAANRTSHLSLLLLLIELLFFGIRPARAQIVQGENPPISGVAAFRPVMASSVCGSNGAEGYCSYTTDSEASLAPNCIEAVCNNTCPHSSSSPPPVSLATLGTFGPGVTTTEGRPGSSAGALRFDSSFVNISANVVPIVGDRGFSFGAWIRQDEGNEGTLVSKSSPDGLERNYVITISQSDITFDYLPDTLDTSSLPAGAQRYRSVIIAGLNLDPSYWHHVAVTVYAEDSAFYVNGTVVGVEALEGRMVDGSTSGTVFLGQTFESAGFYNGLMQQVYFYTQALTAREVTELVTGNLPFVHLSTECRCPPSHPVINPNNEAFCLQHTGGGLTNRGVTDRINSLAHPAGFINDLASSDGWISTPGVPEVNVTLTLTNSLYEVIFINFRYGSPRPRASVLETSRDGGLTFRPVQYFADDCMLYFGLPDNGPITNADDVNCITTESMQLPTSNFDVRTRLVDQGVRPFNLDTSPELRAFILASHIRLRLLDYFTDSTTLQHLYYSVLEVTVAARCACNGHSSRCDSDIDSVCQCIHNTAGDNCERCLPLYNDKSWRYGSTDNGFPCKLCDCNGHALSCRYDPAVDPFPDSYDLGGGGVCEDCQDNTTGQNCETCIRLYYRPPGREPSDPTPCVPCDCDPRGFSDDGDCVKSQGIGGEIAGQCFCKDNVMGMTCDTCRVGFFGLSADNPDGCDPCGCNTAGTFDASTTCDSQTGQCLCKSNVEGLACDQCRAGTTGLNALNPLGCMDCSCNPVGALSNDCDPVSGTCSCKPGVGGDFCEQCLPGFYDFSAAGCRPCTCLSEGAVSNVCDVETGECTCRENVMGSNCDSCADGFYNISAGCAPCGCDEAGAVNRSAACDPNTGQCECKPNVEGRICDACRSGFTNLTTANTEGCVQCDCFLSNTDVSGIVCDPVTAQCECLPSATGLRCDECLSGFYQTPGGCAACDCDPSGAVEVEGCDTVTGQCVCASEGVGGRQCDECLSGFFQFPSCQSCGCDSAGAVAGSECDTSSGECLCKLYVTGDTCDTCISGFQLLDASNPFGCSAAPDEQAPPLDTPLNSTSILLTWLEPEAPNGVILSYSLYRDGNFVINTTETSYTDTGLQPNTEYSYSVEVFNVIGSTRSIAISAQTLQGPPSGIDPPTLQAINSTAVQASWQQPAVANGDISRYELVIVAVGGEPTEEIIFSGIGFSATVSNLRPFTIYSFIVRACTSGGCGSSEATEVQTREAPPTFQPAPNVTVLNATSLEVTWSPPPEPNGDIVEYQIFQRNTPFEGDGFQVGVVSGSVFSFVVNGLQPFTYYEFSVVSTTSGGSTRSEWTRQQTAESVPDEVQPPVLTALSSTTIQVNWTEPERPNGVIIRYLIYMVSLETGERVLLLSSSEIGSFVVDDLQPFTEYGFLVEACTAEGCGASGTATGFTAESAPAGQTSPQVTAENATSVTLRWSDPLEPNGIILTYILQRRRPSLSPSPSLRDIGISFDGTGLATFPPSSSSLGGFSNEISLQFRTLNPYGTLLYYINTVGTDYIALELRSGVPWFFFDAGSGPAAIRPMINGEINFADGLWHQVVATQDGRIGSIIVDGLYSNSGESIGTDQVISSSQTLYVGGIPSDVPRTTVGGMLAPNATLDGRSYAGCLFGVLLNGEQLDFTTQSSPNPGVGSAATGCPVQLDFGVSFLGGGFLALPENTISSSSFTFSFDIRTTDTYGLVLFVYTEGATASMGIEIRESVLYVRITEGNATIETSVGASGICDGLWHALVIEQNGNELSFSLDGAGETIGLSRSDLVFSSTVYVGGVPFGSSVFDSARDAGLNVYAPFSGCTRSGPSSLVVEGVSQTLLPAASEFVRFDGCGNSPGAMCSPPWTSLDVGLETMYTDEGLNPFTSYLYRITPMNSAGQTFSPWEAAMTTESAPSGVGVVAPLSRSVSSITVTWDRPSAPNGIVISYDITATPISTAGLSSPIGSVAMTTVTITVPEMVLLSTLTGLEPATTYSISLTASTAAGVGAGPAVAIATMEAVPFGVQAPFVTFSNARSLGLSWAVPTQSNGIIVRYDLFVNDELRFSGLENSTLVENLEPFTEYALLLQACTSAGCSNSSEGVGQTLPDRPMGLAAPNLTVLSPSSIEATWSPPESLNGVLLGFELRMLFGPELAQSEVVYSGPDLETTITGLTPNTLYTFQLMAFNAGGSVSSPVVQALTFEDIPDGISAPDIEVVNSSTLLVTWQEPLMPNGIIIRYILTQNSTVVFNDLALSYLASDLEPFTAYSYAIMACTAEGCGSSNRSTAMTLEAVPEGYVAPDIIEITANSIMLLVNPVTSPNGIVRYSMYVMGEFALTDGSIVLESRLIFNNSDPDTVTVSDLLPFRFYEFTLSIMNGAGSLVGDPFTVQTAPAAPEDLAPPTLTLTDATTILAEWSPPSRPNGVILAFRLTLFNATRTLTFDQELDTSTSITNLRPFTFYEAFVTANNSVGSVDSATANITTGETAPTGFDQVVIAGSGPRHILLSWDVPAATNGILVNYTVLQNGSTLAAVSPSLREFNVTGLLPFSSYTFSVLACTSVGCVESPSVVAMTMEDVPEGVPSPFVNEVGGTVLVSWMVPATPNGNILRYYIERAPLGGSGNFTQIGLVEGSASRVFADTNTLPFTSYEYRIVAENGAGMTAGPATEFTTPEAAPGRVLPPRLTVLSSSAIEVQFRPPLAPNGILTSYILTQSTQAPPLSIPITFGATVLPMSDGYFIYEDTNLLPFTNYTYLITACTSAGCTSSDPVSEVTFEDTPTGIATPAPLVLNSSSILVSWEEPEQPNGVIQSYDLFRTDLGFYNLSSGLTNCCQDYLQNGNLTNGCSFVTQTSSDVTSYTDGNLQAYSFFEYCIVVTNGADSVYSNVSALARTLPAPMPRVGPVLIATTISSTAIQLSWSSLEISDLLGPLEGYTLYGNIAGTPGLGEVLFTGLAQSYLATGLIASTEYVFVVAVNNGRGATLGNNATATTDEGIPANLTAPTIEALSSQSLAITWTEPLQPNGIITIYTVFLDSLLVHNRTTPGTLVVDGLTPFTLYTVQVEACTQFGCTRSPLVAETTLESAPVGLASPIVLITGPTSANISWSAPTMPNGLITEYQLFQRRAVGCPTCYETVLLFSGIAFEFMVSNLLPFTTYGFEVIAFNSVGNISSGFTMAVTEQAPPTSVDPPIATVLSSTEIALSWSEPSELNGALTGYQIYRNSTFVVSTLSTFYRDAGLEPFTEYSYILEACTGGGCTNSSMVSNTTFEALPQGISDPVISNLEARSLVITWQQPSQPNGVITEYVLTLVGNGTVLFRGLQLTLTLNDLTPFTSYSFQLMVCNSIGCSPSNITEVQTPETAPEGLDAPRLRNLTSTSVAIEWSFPAAANGNITSFILRRGTENAEEPPIIIFQGLALFYNDVDLVAATLYSYAVEAVNGGGSVTSSPSFIRTTPDLAEDIDPPNVDVLGPTSIRITWSPPGTPNGEIIQYILFMDDAPVFTGLGFEYTATDLTPFTLHSYYIQVVNQAGAASSITVTAITDQAPPDGVNPPSLTVLGPTAIQVSWQPPTRPNGIITEYEIRRRLLDNALTESVQHRGDASVLSFPNSGLDPFTTYEYRLRVINEAGNTFSEWVPATTEEDIPEGVGLPRFSDSTIFARNVTATWDPPSQPNGVLLSYRLEYRLPLDPSTNMPGTPITAAEVSADVTTAVATGLQPVTLYEFRVVAINAAGEGFGSWETVTTGEDVPEGVQPIVVEERTGTTLSLTWSSPLMPNGIIREYMLLLDGELVYRDVPATYTVLRLQPFTSYNLQLAACTSAGCTFGEVQSVTTAEVAPFGQPSPNLTALGPRSIEITWDSTAQPNGIITRYEILRQISGIPTSLAVIRSTDDTLSRFYIDSAVQPATTYEYAVRAINSAGQTESDFRAITTPDAPPEGLATPELTVLSSSSIGVAWGAPSQPNGAILLYQAFRTAETSGIAESVYTGQNREFTDTTLDPFMTYSYTIQACTAGGCSNSSSASATTLEDFPEDFASPVLSALSATEISVQWSPPARPNGAIVGYVVDIAPIGIRVTTMELAVSITNLQPFTIYTVSIDACNSIGCATSSGQVQTAESLPQFIAPPQLAALTPTSVQVTWQEPARPNGVILFYELRRNGSLIFSNNATSFADTNLMPNQFYSYTIQAYTSIGGGEMSSVRTIQTPPDTPEDISPPTLVVLGPNTIFAQWVEPGRPNGDIQRYILEVDGVTVYEEEDVFMLEFTVENLSPFTQYEFRLVVCTSTCGNSPTVTVTTAEAPPLGQGSPLLTANPNTTVSANWSPPSQPNGIITAFKLERRQVFNGNNRSELVIVFIGTATTYLDSDPLLQAAMIYEYQVTANNSAGSVTSDLAQVTLQDAPPVGVSPPTLSEIVTDSLLAVVSPPRVPNGQIVLYRLYQNGSSIGESVPESQTASVSFVVRELSPFTAYAYHVEACTSAGCSASEAVVIRTAEAPPTGLGTPTAVALSARSIRIDWSTPTDPNGIIVRYLLWFRLACPQPPQPRLSNLPPCVEGSRTMIPAIITPSNQLTYTFTGSDSNDPIPYTAYQFQVEAQNSVGNVTSPYSNAVETPTAAPEPIPASLIFEIDQEAATIQLDWSQTFHLNGPFRHFILVRNNIMLLQTLDLRVTLTNEPVGAPLEYVITTVTEIGQVSTDVYVLQLDGTPPTTLPTESPTLPTEFPTLPTESPTLTQPPVITTPVPADDDVSDEPAFIIGMVIIGIAIVFIVCGLFLCCIRPKRERGLRYKTGGSLRLQRSPTKSGYEQMTPSPKHEHKPVTGSWSPGDRHLRGEVPDLGEEELGPVILPSMHSYSPHKVERAALLDYEVNEHPLPDTHIAGPASNFASPQQFVSAKEDFGTFRASQTTFQDTKV